MEEICDKCGDEMDSRTSMPNPAMGNGSLCSECYLTAEEDLAHQKGMAWIRQQLPSMGQFMEIYCRHCQVEVDKARLEGNCHAAASALVGWFRKKNLTAKIKRGHWLGGDVRPGRREYPAQQHSWVEIALPDNSAGFFLDPTQFVFTGADPGISISRKDDYRYDAGSYRLKELCMGTRQMPERNGHPAQPSTLSDEAKQVITILYGKQIGTNGRAKKCTPWPTPTRKDWQAMPGKFSPPSKNRATMP
jgi:hypothetical protein